MYKPFEGIVEGDASQAAFYAVLSAVTKTPFLIHNMNHDSHQGDAVILDIMKQFGAGVEEIADGYQIIPHDLKAAEVDLEDCPDLGPALFALATQAEGKSIFRNAGRLRIKESDRIQAMEEELRKLGCSISSDENTVYVEGMTKLKGGVDLCGHNDHRIVMALSVLSSGCEKPVMIHGAEAVNKSYPQFYDHLKKTGIGVNLYD